MSKDFEQIQPPSGAELAVAEYRKGMKAVGRSLIALGILAMMLVLIASSTIRSLQDKMLSYIIVLMPLAAIYLVLGIFSLRMHAWVNYVVVVLGSLALLLNGASFVLIPARAETAGPGSCFGLLIAGAFAYYGVKNLRMLSQARALGADI